MIMCNSLKQRRSSACLFKKEAYEKTDKKYVTYKAGGDMLFWIEIAEQGNVSIINKKLCYYRIHSEKVTSRMSKLGINMKEYKITYDYLIKTKILSKKKENLIRDYVHFLLLHGNFVTDEIKNDLLKIWDLPEKMNIIKTCRICILKGMQERFGLLF